MIPRTLFEPEHDLFRAAFRRFVETEMVPYHDKWEADGRVDRSLFTRAGAAGFLGMAAPAAYGGGGAPDFRFNVIQGEEFARAGVVSSGLGLSLHNDICLPYILTAASPEQQQRWLPGICSGQRILAVAMTEPGAGSDLASLRTTARRDGDHYVLSGSKTFISNGFNCDLVIVAATTDPAAGRRGITLLVVEDGMDGFERGRKLDKIGLRAQDTAELFFHDVRVPAAYRLGGEGEGFAHLMGKLVQERLSCAAAAVAAAEAAFGWSLDYARDRHAFGQPIGSFQANRFTLAEMRTELDLARVFVDRCVELHNQGALTGEDAAKAKWWCTDLQNRVVTRGLQLHGGYGYMLEYPIARAYLDARIGPIYAGTNEIMKEIIGRSLGV